MTASYQRQHRDVYIPISQYTRNLDLAKCLVRPGRKYCESSDDFMAAMIG